MKPKCIGIVGGAGPLAGLFLVEQIIKLSGIFYGCHKDRDFPKIILISFPFSEMLSSKIDEIQLRKELNECLTQLRKNGAEILAIACNTLHAFLNEKEDLSDLVHLVKIITPEIPMEEVPLVLCTSTSVQFGIHKKFFPCIYPDIQTQSQIDTIIDEILKEKDKNLAIKKLLKILENQKEKTIILGCTELSLLTDQLLHCKKSIIDPLKIASKKILEKSFLKQ